MGGMHLKNQKSKTVISPFDMFREGPLEFFAARKPCLVENKVLTQF